MAGLGDNKWTPNPTKGTSTAAPAPASRRQPGGTNKHVSVPAFGYAPPSAPFNPPALPQSTPKPFQKAEAAGKAAAKRMDELQSDANTSTKPFLYQNYGYPPPQPNFPARPTVALSATIPLSDTTHPATENAEQQRARLHELFITWVPRADEFYNTYTTLDLTAEELKAIQDEIVSYRVNSAMAAGKHTSYRAEWETALAHLAPQHQAEGGAKAGNQDDPLGLGLPMVAAEVRRIGDLKNWLD